MREYKGYHFDTIYPKSSSRLAGTRAETIDEVILDIKYSHERALKQGYDHSKDIIYITRFDWSRIDDDDGNFISRSESERVVAVYQNGKVTMR